MGGDTVAAWKEERVGRWNKVRGAKVEEVLDLGKLDLEERCAAAAESRGGVLIWKPSGISFEDHWAYK